MPNSSPIPFSATGLSRTCRSKQRRSGSSWISWSWKNSRQHASAVCIPRSIRSRLRKRRLLTRTTDKLDSGRRAETQTRAHHGGGSMHKRCCPEESSQQDQLEFVPEYDSHDNPIVYGRRSRKGIWVQCEAGCEKDGDGAWHLYEET